MVAAAAAVVVHVVVVTVTQSISHIVILTSVGIVPLYPILPQSMSAVAVGRVVGSVAAQAPG